MEAFIIIKIVDQSIVMKIKIEDIKILINNLRLNHNHWNHSIIWIKIWNQYQSLNLKILKTTYKIKAHHNSPKKIRISIYEI
jgi:hypothetical protein